MSTETEIRMSKKMKYECNSTSCHLCTVYLVMKPYMPSVRAGVIMLTVSTMYVHVGVPQTSEARPKKS